jgi:hypothetical protein
VEPGLQKSPSLQTWCPGRNTCNTRGFPQGNVLGAIIYIYTAQLNNNLPPGCRIIEFADDICLFSSVALLEAAVRNTEEGVNKVDETLQTPDLEISSQKTKFMVFSLNNQGFYNKRKRKEGKKPRRPLIH